jgi:hypothetical protein
MIRNVLVCDLCAAEIPAGAPHAVLTPTGPGAHAVLSAVGPVASFDLCPRCADDLGHWALGRKAVQAQPVANLPTEPGPAKGSPETVTLLQAKDGRTGPGQ